MEGQRYAGAYKVTKPTKWSDEETDKFYDALAQFGEDLFLIQTRFKDKTANQISMKLRSERKRNPKRFNQALDNPKSITKEAWQSSKQNPKKSNDNFTKVEIIPEILVFEIVLKQFLRNRFWFPFPNFSFLCSR